MNQELTIKKETGELIETFPVDSKSPKNEAMDAYAIERFKGAGTLSISKDQQKILTSPPTVDEIQEDKARGLFYMSHATIRQRLNEAFGIGGWALVPVNKPLFERGLILTAWDLYVQGVFVSRATGEMRWLENNPQMTKGDALEGSKSNALTRCCKDLGIGIQLWDKNFIGQLRSGTPLQNKQKENVKSNEKGKNLDIVKCCTFGKDKGVRWDTMPTSKLDFYWAYFERLLKDPKVEKYYPEYIKAMEGIEATGYLKPLPEKESFPKGEEEVNDVA